MLKQRIVFPHKSRIVFIHANIAEKSFYIYLHLINKKTTHFSHISFR